MRSKEKLCQYQWRALSSWEKENMWKHCGTNQTNQFWSWLHCWGYKFRYYTKMLVEETGHRGHIASCCPTKYWRPSTDLDLLTSCRNWSVIPVFLDCDCKHHNRSSILERISCPWSHLRLSRSSGPMRNRPSGSENIPFWVWLVCKNNLTWQFQVLVKYLFGWLMKTRNRRRMLVSMPKVCNPELVIPLRLYGDGAESYSHLISRIS